MQAGQVSVYIPILVGVIGVIGVVAGQLVSAWREDRRAKREAERDATRLAHEDRNDWRDERLSVYSRYFASGKEWTRHLQDYARAAREAKHSLESKRGELKECRQKISDLLALIELIGSEQVVAVSREMYGHVREIHDNLIEGEHSSESLIRTESILRKRCPVLAERMRSCFRHDLGTSLATVEIPIIPSSPSDQTS